MTHSLPQASEEVIRAEFEAWHRKEFPDVVFEFLLGAYLVTSLTPRPHGSFVMNERWHTWQAARASQPLPQPPREKRARQMSESSLLVQAHSALMAEQPPQGVMADDSTDPMDWPLPCDVKIGAGTNKKGTPLRALVQRANSLHKLVRLYSPKPSPEEMEKFYSDFPHMRPKALTTSENGVDDAN